ncbi:TetR/AcrR family transcriptional regulator [Subtercola sp. YIM 133946]|uniref:TetR/AcrR family transcriptional regulator n=1 Tax=Subtercola sp. YIM 133946 TaxID=3118909 RepID=UPI002F927F7A
MPKVTAEYRDARRHEIARAALRLFAQKGFQATSMADIIAESGLSAGAIYGHYKSKDELIHHAISDILQFRLDAVGSLDADSPVDPGELLRRFVTAMGEEVGDLGLLLQVWAQAALDPSSREATDSVGAHLRRVFESYLTDWYARGLRMPGPDAARDATLFAPLYVGLVQGYVIQNAIFDSFDREAYFAAASALRPAQAVNMSAGD